MGRQKIKRGPARKAPKRRQAEARALQEPQYRPRIVRQVPRAERNGNRWLDEYEDQE